MFGWLFGKKKKKNTEKIVEQDVKEIKKEEPVIEEEPKPEVKEEVKPESKEEVKEEPKEEPKEEKKEEPVKKRKQINHITKHPQGGWQIKKSGSQRALKRFKTQKEAIEYAKHLEDTTETAYVIHKADGTTRKKTY